MTAKQTITISLLLLMILVIPGVIMAADKPTSPAIDLPATMKIQQDSDITSQLFGRLFGESWGEVTDAQLQQSGLGTYSGLIVSILGVLNVASMVFVASSIIYLWGIFAVTTAHEGRKLGGSVFNSLWLPVRHAFSFSLTVPILNGLSLMQISIFACLAVSINLANVIWKASAGWLVEHSSTAVMASATPAFEHEALRAVPYAFSDAVAQRVIAETGLTRRSNSWLNWIQDYTGIDIRYEDPEKKAGYVNMMYGLPYDNSSQYRRTFYNGLGQEVSDPTLKEGVIVVQDDTLTGDRSIFFEPYEGISEKDITKIHIPLAPVKKNGRGQSVQVSSEAAAFAKALGEKRTQEVIKLLSSTWVLAERWLHTPKSANNSIILSPLKEYDSEDFDLQTPMRRYSENMAAYVKEKSAELTKLMQQHAGLGVGRIIGLNNAGETVGGWVSAGLFYLGLTGYQKALNDSFLQSVKFTAPSNHGRDFLSSENRETLNEPAKIAITNAPHFVSEEMLKGSSYASSAFAQSEGGTTDFLKDIASAIAAIVIMPSQQGDANRVGLLGQTLDLFATHDPIVVMAAFGDRLITAALGVSIGATVLSFTTGNTIGIAVIGILLIVGIIFAYIVPITPVIFWLRALLTWVFMVIEALVAAPFWVCAHALPEGAGFAGQHARRGYMMLLNILIRPTLMVLGAVFAIAIVQAMGWLFDKLLSRWFTTVGSSFIEMGILADISYTIVVMSLMYYLSLTLFTKGVNYLPDSVMRWAGGEGGGSQGESEDTSKIILAGAAFKELSGQLSSSAGKLAGLGAGARGQLDKLRAKKAEEEEEKNKKIAVGANLPSMAEGAESAGENN